MFRTIVPLLFLFSLTTILLRPSSNHVNYNTWSVLEGENDSNKGSNGRRGSSGNVNAQGHLEIGYVFKVGDGRENTIVRSRRKKMLQTMPIRGQTACKNSQSFIKLSTWILSSPSPTSSLSPSPTSSLSSSSTLSLSPSFSSLSSLLLSPLSSFLLLSLSSSPPLLSPLPSPSPSSPSPLSPSSPSPSPLSSPSPLPSPSPSSSSSPSLSSSPISIRRPISGSHRFRKRKVIIGIAIAVPTALLICMIICCFRYKSLRRQFKLCLTPKSGLDIEGFLRNHGALAQKRYKFSEVKKMTNSFKVKLGQGGFGAVYKGKLPTGGHVAVKLLNASKGNGEEFINEVASISRTSHINVVTLVGFCLEGRKKALIYEFMANGSLDKFIYKKGPETIASLSWEILYQIATGIGRGLEYLHRGCNTRILHFDIKPHNILLDENFCPKISDFGLAKLCPRKESIISMSDARGTMGYVAPEMCNRHFGGVSHKSDVYSYGMMLLEMVGGRKNINAEASDTSAIYFPHLVFRRLEQDSDLRPDQVMTSQENEIARRLTIVGLWCIQTFPDDRPTMSRVIDMLEGSMNSLEIPPKPMFSSPTRSETEPIEE